MGRRQFGGEGNCRFRARSLSGEDSGDGAFEARRIACRCRLGVTAVCRLLTNEAGRFHTDFPADFPGGHASNESLARIDGSSAGVSQWVRAEIGHCPSEKGLIQSDGRGRTGALAIALGIGNAGDAHVQSYAHGCMTVHRLPDGWRHSAQQHGIECRSVFPMVCIASGNRVGKSPRMASRGHAWL